jgi:hypothetical protein
MTRPCSSDHRPDIGTVRKPHRYPRNHPPKKIQRPHIGPGTIASLRCLALKVPGEGLSARQIRLPSIGCGGRRHGDNDTVLPTRPSKVAWRVRNCR